jgi:hypothetical protein
MACGICGPCAKSLSNPCLALLTRLQPSQLRLICFKLYQVLQGSAHDVAFRSALLRYFWLISVRGPGSGIFGVLIVIGLVLFSVCFLELLSLFRPSSSDLIESRSIQTYERRLTMRWHRLGGASC